MCHAALAEASRNLRLILTLTRASQSFRSIPSNASRTSSDASSSYESARGLGSDFGNFLYWFGERLLEGWGEIIIRVRLLSIHRALQHKGIVEHADTVQANFVRHACEDILDLCRCACMFTGIDIPYSLVPVLTTHSASGKRLWKQYFYC